MSEMLLRALGLGCVVGQVQLFDDLNFELSGGDILEVSGPNGSGKSTLLRCMAGLKLATTGTLERDIQDCAYLGHRLGIQPTLTVVENLRLFAQLARLNDPTDPVLDLDEPLLRFDLERHRHKIVDTLSEGLKRRCALARVWIQKKRIWILDEPRSALDEASSHVLQEVIDSHRKDDGAIALVSHQSLDLPNTKTLNLV